MFQTRPKVIGQRGMVATSQPLATQVGLQILKNGGNAIDAAIAANATMGFSSLRSSAAQCPDGSGEAPASSGYWIALSLIALKNTSILHEAWVDADADQIQRINKSRATELG